MAASAARGVHTVCCPAYLLLHGSLCCQRGLRYSSACRAAFAGNVPLLIRLLRGCSTDEQQQLDSQGNTVSCWPRQA